MSGSVNILGIDPGFASVGIVIVGMPSVGAPSLLYGDVWHTSKSSKKQNVLAANDNVRRTRLLARQFLSIIDQYQVKLIAAEYMSFPRNASNAAKMALCWGAISTVCEVLDPMPLLQASPQNVKKSLCDSADASKEDVWKAACVHYPNLEAMLDAQAKGDREHLGDAAAVTVTVRDSDEMRLLRSMLR